MEISTFAWTYKMSWGIVTSQKLWQTRKKKITEVRCMILILYLKKSAYEQEKYYFRNYVAIHARVE